jgi:diguanylate cyclase (GGDEF)-like protein
MRLLTQIARSRAYRQLALLLAACVLLPLLVVAVLGGREFGAGVRERQAQSLSDDARSLGQAVATRVAAADALAAGLIAVADLTDPVSLRAATARSGVFARVLTDEAELAAVPPVRSESPGSTAALMTTATTVAGNGSVYIARRLGSPQRSGRLVYFEIAPRWLWQEVDLHARAAVVTDAAGTVLRHSVAMQALPEPARIAADAAVGASRGGIGPRALSWQAGQQTWRGAVATPAWPATLAVDRPWNVAVYEPASPAAAAGFDALLPAALTALTVALALVLAGVVWIGARRLPFLSEIEAAIARFGVGSLVPLDRARQPAELVALADAVNAAGARLHAEVRALEILSEIDRQLLAATELEPVLDSILQRVTEVTRCNAVGIALLDGDSPTHGRVYAASAARLDLPVSRVEFDPEMIDSLAAADEAITIARCEEGRHSFLTPLRELGCEFFWVWPVGAGRRLGAVLAIGFREAPATDPRIARWGSGFAERLAIALSKTARDEHLYRQAHFDPLTSLPNRLLFRDRLEQELASVSDGRGRGALLYVDLDHFKRVNDSVGHAAGDQLLQVVAQRLRACVKDGDTVARLAGDEFTIILRNVPDPESASVVAERIIDSIGMPVNLGGRDHYVQASVGITLFPDDASGIDELMRNADRAMYRAKQQGRSRAVFFDRNLMTSRFETSHSGLYRALRRREFSLYYQPQFSLADGRLVGLEALLRWQTPRDGTRTPEEFVPAAETSGLIVDIGGWVLDAACTQWAVWREQGIAPARLSVNVSVQQLKSAEFPRNVRRVLDKYGIPPQVVEIELTESVFADEAAGASMRQLAEIGVRLALDDFGTGYSSLNYLRQHPIDVIKIDRSFLEEVPLDDSAATLTGTIISMAHALGKEVVAEGVERVEQLDFLRERGCDYAQGYYLARPLTVAQVGDLLHTQHALRDSAGIGALREAG